jgi:hypothetical protein
VPPVSSTLGAMVCCMPGKKAFRGAPNFTPKGRREPNGPRLPSFNYLAYFLHPEQEAQQSAEAQHDAFAAFTPPAKLSAITAINRIALMFFMDFSPLKNQVGFCQPMATPSVWDQGKTSCGDF